ncbi:GNS1/SUR4 family protein [Ophiocordyceps camponoti-floridani]|uniref:Elongation of fatty acids protein n=1 Tax=Ophiocordyceps camponoti-floridani TaxID=2030778 RepID=A0A8H4Q4V1_9HYPO|nr:GNS1/SUR4 family protein [Ophiocordyceps camponoti-floridani]
MAIFNAHHAAITIPNFSQFSFPPTGQPPPLAPKPTPSSVMRPFNIPENIYAAALDPRVPLTIATVYAITATALTWYNRSRNKRPWAISKTRAFFAFVILHNVALAVYSAWTFWGMAGVMTRSIRWPWGPGGLPAMLDGFCRIHGPGRLGASLYYHEDSGRWLSADASAMVDALDAGGSPIGTPMGRIWSEGLDYYGWIFYLSKFYEVLDTFIILAKGKPSSILQTYHHSGAMMCMWAGMRFMSAPIWMFASVNSLIHAFMYTYYTLTALSIKVPMRIKRTLTTMQIIQFILGAFFATLHLFVTYLTPITVPRRDGPGMPASPTDSDIPVASGVFGSVKQLLFGPVLDETSPAISMSPLQPSSSMMTETVYVAQPCIITRGETFAIWLNTIYLAPLTYLFVSFFIASYVKRREAGQKANGKTKHNDNVTMAEKAGWDAARGVGKVVYGSDGSISPITPISPASSASPVSPASPVVISKGPPSPKKANGRARRRL